MSGNTTVREVLLHHLAITGVFCAAYGVGLLVCSRLGIGFAPDTPIDRRLETLMQGL